MSILIQSSDLPDDQDWPAILNLDIKAVRALTVSEFISRIKLGSRLRIACRAMAERDIREKKDQGLPIDALANKNREVFGRSARSYISHLFSSVQNQKTLTTDLMKGLGSFDLDTLLHDPLPHAVYCFSQLFTSFRLRGYFSLEQETECQDEYVSFRDDLQRRYPDLHQPTLFILDTVGFLIEQSSLQSRPLLLKLFRLACLCLDEPFQTLPPVKIGSLDSDDPTSSFVDVVLPVQSYFRNVPNGIESVNSDQSVAAFLRLEHTFVGVGTSDVYSPWESVNFFDRASVLEQLDPNGTCRRGQNLDPVSKSSDATRPVSSKKSGVSKKMSHLVTGNELTRSAENLLSASSSKF